MRMIAMIACLLYYCVTMNYTYCQSAHDEWQGVKHTTMFCPGILSSELQTLKYCASYKASNGCIIQSVHGNTIFDGLNTIACNFAEMIPLDIFQNSSNNAINRLLSNCTEQGLKLSSKRFGPYAINQDQNYCIPPRFKIDWRAVNFGQDKDIELLKSCYTTLTTTTNTSVVAYGFSRGSGCLFNFIATAYAQCPIKNIRAVVLEACFESVDACTSGATSWLLEKGTHYRSTGPSPMKLIKQFAQICISHNISVLFIVSKKDDVIPHKQTYRICKQLSKLGMQNLYILPLEHSKHNGALFDHKDDIKAYHQGIHLFYKIHGLSYIPFWAEQSSNVLQRI